MPVFPSAVQRPHGAAHLRLKSGHPLAEHVVAAWSYDVSGVLREIISGALLWGREASARLGATAAGMAVYPSAYTPETFRGLHRMQRAARVSQFWFGCVLDDGVNLAAGNPVFCGLYHNNSNSPPYFCYAIARPSTTGLMFGYNNAGTFGSVNASGVIAASEYGRPMSLACTYGTDAVVGYKNGREIARGGGIAGITYGASAEYHMGSHAWNSFNKAGVATALVLVFGTVLTPTQHAELAANPYALFVEPKSTWFNPAPTVPTVPPVVPSGGIRHESTVAITVDGVSMLPAVARRSLAWESTLNGRSTASLVLLSRENTLASPAFRDPVVVSIDGVPVFGGVVLQVERQTIAGVRGAAFALQCGGWEVYAETTRINGIIHGPITFRDAFTMAAGQIAHYGITVSAAMSVGPTLDSMGFPFRTIAEIWTEQGARAGAQWRIGADKVARAEVAGVVPAPFGLGVGGEAVSIRGARCVLEGANYLNVLWVGFGTAGQTRAVTDTIAGNGTRTIPLSYGAAVAPTAITVNGAPFTLGAGLEYEFQSGPDRIVQRSDQPILTAADTVVAAFTAGYPSVVLTQDDPSFVLYGEVSETIELPDVYDVAAARAYGNAILAVRSNLPRVASLTIWRPGIVPGMAVPVDLPALDMAGDWLCRRVKGAHLLKTRRDPARHTFGYELELVEGGAYRDGWESYFREGTAGGGALE